MKPLIMMISRLLAVGFVCLSLSVAGFVEAATVVTQPDVFTPGVWPEATMPATHYGELHGWPHTFVFAVATTTVVRYQLAARPDTTLPALLLVRENERGVSEIVRQTASKRSVDAAYDWKLGLTLATAEVVTATLEPGRYRLEVSSATNEAQYQLVVGETEREGFFASIQHAFVAQGFFAGWVGALITWRVGVLLVLLLGMVGWWLRKRLYA